jgi:antitoxin component of MazEF toxin-antitoxin module
LRQTGKKPIFPPMGYPVKIQKVERPTNKSFYVNFPAALAEAIGMDKGEDFEWLVEDKNTLVFRRSRPKPQRKLKSNRP